MLRGQKVRLAPLDHGDIGTFLKWFNDYEVQRLLAIDAAVPLTQEAEEAWYDQAVKEVNAHHFSIRLLEEGALIGNVSLFGLNSKNRSAELGIAIGEKDYWGRGYGSEAIGLLLAFAFDELNLRRVQLEVIDYNHRAIRAYEKLGFVREGVRRGAVYREGEYHDLILMALLATEWRENDNANHSPNAV